MSGTATGHLYWDSCIFVAHLNDEKADHGTAIDDISQFLDESKQGKWKIYTSTLTIAEIPRNRLRRTTTFASFGDFLRDYRDAVIQVTPDPNIMETAAELHGMLYTKTTGVRKLATPDAIHFATALALGTVYGVTLDAFHTFDNGGRRGVDGRAVPMLSYELWCEKCRHEPIVQRVIGLNRVIPTHPTPRLDV